MAKEKKILYVITNADLGGAQVHLYEVISRLPSYIIPYVISGNRGWLSDKLGEIGVTVIIVPTLIRSISLKNDIKAFYGISHIIKSLNPDIIHCHSSKAGVIGRLVAKKYCVPAVFTAHGWAFTEGVSVKRRKLYQFIERQIARWTEKIICVSEYDRKLASTIMAKHKMKLLTIHNGISDCSIARKIRRTEGVLSLVMVARFASPKNQQQLIDAVEQLNNEGLNINLTLIGNGPRYIEIFENVKDRMIGKYINFLGGREDIDVLLSNYDVFCLISKWEGLPISILEAMRAELPVIASDVGGVSEVVKNGVTGYLVPRDDLNLLKEKIRKCYFNPGKFLEMGMEGRKLFQEEFTSNIMMKKLLSIYDGLFYHNKL